MHALLRIPCKTWNEPTHISQYCLTSLTSDFNITETKYPGRNTCFFVCLFVFVFVLVCLFVCFVFFWYHINLLCYIVINNYDTINYVTTTITTTVTIFPGIFLCVIFPNIISAPQRWRREYVYPLPPTPSYYATGFYVYFDGQVQTLNYFLCLL